MNDMSSTIVPRSDQLAADHLLAGPLTITITRVTIKPGEQPVTVEYEGGDGLPYKPGKSMCRVLVAMWGPDATAYTGKSLTLYRDPSVTWAGLEVGGIRISHASDITSAHTMALTETRGKKKPFTVRPLARKAAPAPQLPRPGVRDVLRAALTAATSRADVLAACELPAVAKILREGPEDQRLLLQAMINDTLDNFPEPAPAMADAEDDYDEGPGA